MTLRIGGRARFAAFFVIGLMAATSAEAMQCVPYARAASGIELRGDAWRWWNAAAGVYDRGHAPRLGAVMVFRKYGRMRLGHVAVVTHIVDSRQVLIDHANWGPRGIRGSVAKEVAVRDFSRHNDWSQVRVWNPMTQDFGTRTYPTYGFIYPRGEAPVVKASLSSDTPEFVLALMTSAPSAAADRAAQSGLESREDASAGNLVAELQALMPIPVSAMAADAFDEGPTPRAADAKPARSDGVWEGDHGAAVRAGSGRY